MSGVQANRVINNTSVYSITDYNSSTNLTYSEKTPIKEDEYDLGAHRDHEKTVSTRSTLAHFLKCSLGSGVLAMPLAFSNAGLLFGIIATVVCGFICGHCVHILVKVSQSICRELRVPSLTYADTALRVFENGPKAIRSWSKFAYQFVDYGLMLTYYSAACVYVLFVSTSFHDVLNMELGINWDIRIYIVLSLIFFIIMGQIRNLKVLAPFSATANVLIVVAFGITYYYILQKPLDFSARPLIVDWKRWPYFLSTVIFAMEGIGIVMPLENAMRKPQDFLGCPGILNISMTVVVFLYTLTGVLGYVRFDDIRGSITLNLPDREPLADATKLLMAIGILFTFGIQFYIPNEILWRRIKHKIKKENRNKYNVLMRLFFTLLLGVACIAIPKLDPFISLVGAIFFSLIGLFTPCVIETVYLWPNNLGWCKWILIKNIICILFSLIALFSGTFVSVKDIIAIYTG